MPPELLIACVILAALMAYAVLGGADFGGGVWEFNLAFRADERERRLIASAISPVWEANHVWLIFVIVLLVNGFPTAFAALSRALWLPLLLALLGIVFRGAAFAFRAYAIGAERQKQLWQTVFALASTLTPFFLGAAIGAVASGEIEVTSDGNYAGDYLFGWVSVFSIFTAFFSVGMCAYLAAVFLTREAHQANNPLVTTWRRRSLAVGVVMGVLAGIGLVLVAFAAPTLWDGFLVRGWPLVLLSAVGGFSSLWAMHRSRFNLAAAGAIVAVAAVVVGWGIAQYPALIPPGITVSNAKAPDVVLWLMAGCIGIGSLILLPSLGWLFYIFKRAGDAQ